MDKLFKISFNKWPAILWAIFVLCLSIIPGPKFPSSFSIPHLDKIVHFTFYSVMTILFVNGWNKSKKRKDFWVIGLVIYYGFTIELVQHFLIIQRYFDLWDVLANSVGAVIGYWVNFKILNNSKDFNIK